MEDVVNKLFCKYTNNYLLIHTIFIWGFVFIYFADVLKTRNDLLQGTDFNEFRNVGKYINNNLKQRDIIFHADWDDFPPLFYYSPNNYYIVGLDPTFMYNYDKNLYEEYTDITLGKDRDNLDKKIINDFRAQYIFLDKGHLNFNDNLISNQNFKLVYKDDNFFLYKIK